MSHKGSPITPDKDDIYFISTQIQARHEEVVESENKEKEKKKFISKLKSFRNEEVVEIPRRQINRTPKAISKASSCKGKKDANKKNKSMSAMVRDTFNNEKQTFTSSNQSKIDNFLQKLNKDDISNIERSNDGNLYTKNDWFYIMQNIKLKFPDLNAKHKKSLKSILKKITKFEEESSVPVSIWSEASSHPEIKLSDEDLRWLYDLDEEEMLNNSSIIDYDWYKKDTPFVLTLSQALNDNSEIISDSESDLEILREYPNSHIINEDEQGSYNGGISSERNDMNKVLVDSIGSIQFKEPVSEMDIFEEKQKMNEESLVFSGLQDFEEEISSPKDLSPEADIRLVLDSSKTIIASDNKNLIGTTNVDENRINSEDEVIVLSEVESVNSLQNYEEIIVSESDNELVSSIPQKPVNKKRRLLRTTRLEVSKNLNLYDYEDTSKNLEIKYIGTKIISVDPENEVEDSEAEDNNSLSIIEITREIDDTDMLIDLNRNKGEEKNISLIQVPSSPEISSESNIDNTDFLANTDFLNLKSNNESIDYNESPISEANSNTYMTASEYYTPLVHFDQGEGFDMSKPDHELGIEKTTGLNEATSQLKTKNCGSVKNTQELKSIYDKLTNTLKQSQFWFEKIVSFEPLFLDELKDWLNSTDIGITLDKPSLEKYCEKYGITYSNASK